MISGDIGGRSDNDLIKECLSIKDNVIALLKHKNGTYDIHTTHNLITTDGANWYAENASLNKNTPGSPTNDFDYAFLGNPGTPDVLDVGDKFNNWVQGSLLESTKKQQTFAAINNLDTDNGGKGPFKFTWKFEWTGGDFNTSAVNNVQNGIISTVSPSGTDPILNHWNFSTTFQKLATSTLIVWVNHTFADDTP